MKTKEVWIYIEQNNNKIAEVSLELLSKGIELAKKLNVKTGALLLGANVKNNAKKLFSYGADKDLWIFCYQWKQIE